MIRLADWLLCAAAWGAPDRSEPPEVPPPQALPAPALTEQQPTDDVTVTWLSLPGTTRAAIVYVAGVRGTAPWSPGEGAAWAALWGQQTATHDEVTLHRAKRALDLDTAAFHAPGMAGWIAELPVDAWQEALPLLDAMVRAPRFGHRQTRRLGREGWRDLYQRIHSDPSDAMDDALTHAWHAAHHPLRALPDPPTLRGLRPKAVHTIHRRVLRLRPIQVFVVGDLDPAKHLASLRPLWQHEEATLSAEGERLPSDPPSPRTLGVHVPDTSLAAVGLRLPAPPAGHPDEPAYHAAQWILGGHFSSRINHNLRETRGWTYGAFGQLDVAHEGGHWTVAAEVAPERVPDTLRQIDAELRRMGAQGPTSDELTAYRHQQIADSNRRRRTPTEAARRWLDDTVAGRGPFDRRLHLPNDASPTLASVQRAAREWLDPERAVVVISGPRSRIEPSATQAGIGISWYGALDAALGRLEERTE